jgi:hypothetical protein
MARAGLDVETVADGPGPADRARPRLVFIHIPKCAGSAVRGAIRRTYFPVHHELLSRLRRQPGYAYDSIRLEAAHDTAQALGLNLPAFHTALLFYAMSLPKNGFVAGHVPFSRAAADAFASQWQFITILREPISRFLSEYFYNRFKESHYFRIDDDLERYLDTADARRTATQFTNFLTGRHDEYAMPTEADVTAAVGNLERFAVVGFQDDMEGFAAAMAARFGRRPKVPHTNRNPAPAGVRERDIVPAIHERIVELCAADLEIYRRARQERGGAAGAA